MLKVYLAGSVHEKEYRAQVAKDYSGRLNIFDPMKEIEPDIIEMDPNDVEDLKAVIFTPEQKKQIVEQDKEAVATCDIVVAYVRKFSAGTIMEVLHAWNHQIPVYTIVEPGSQIEHDVWLTYHTSKLFYDIESCFEHIMSTLEYEE